MLLFCKGGIELRLQFEVENVDRNPLNRYVREEQRRSSTKEYREVREKVAGVWIGKLARSWSSGSSSMTAGGSLSTVLAGGEGEDVLDDKTGRETARGGTEDEKLGVSRERSLLLARAVGVQQQATNKTFSPKTNSLAGGLKTEPSSPAFAEEPLVPVSVRTTVETSFLVCSRKSLTRFLQAQDLDHRFSSDYLDWLPSAEKIIQNQRALAAWKRHKAETLSANVLSKRVDICAHSYHLQANQQLGWYKERSQNSAYENRVRLAFEGRREAGPEIVDVGDATAGHEQVCRTSFLPECRNKRLMAGGSCKNNDAGGVSEAAKSRSSPQKSTEDCSGTIFKDGDNVLRLFHHYPLARGVPEDDEVLTKRTGDQKKPRPATVPDKATLLRTEGMSWEFARALAKADFSSRGKKIAVDESDRARRPRKSRWMKATSPRNLLPKGSMKLRQLLEVEAPSSAPSGAVVAIVNSSSESPTRTTAKTGERNELFLGGRNKSPFCGSTPPSRRRTPSCSRSPAVQQQRDIQDAEREFRKTVQEAADNLDLDGLLRANLKPDDFMPCSFSAEQCDRRDSLRGSGGHRNRKSGQFRLSTESRTTESTLGGVMRHRQFPSRPTSSGGGAGGGAGGYKNNSSGGTGRPDTAITVAMPPPARTTGCGALFKNRECSPVMPGNETALVEDAFPMYPLVSSACTKAGNYRPPQEFFAGAGQHDYVIAPAPQEHHESPRLGPLRLRISTIPRPFTVAAGRRRGRTSSPGKITSPGKKTPSKTPLRVQKERRKWGQKRRGEDCQVEDHSVMAYGIRGKLAMAVKNAELASRAGRGEDVLSLF